MTTITYFVKNGTGYVEVNALVNELDIEFICNNYCGLIRRFSNEIVSSVRSAVYSGVSVPTVMICELEYIIGAIYGTKNINVNSIAKDRINELINALIAKLAGLTHNKEVVSIVRRLGNLL